MTRYWIAVASREHVRRATHEGFMQICHGKIAQLKHMSPGDWIIYYSPTHSFGGKDICRAFTAIGRVDQGDPYTFEMSSDFIPWRRDVTFATAKDAPISPLLERLSFIKGKKSWGLPFRRGCFEILEADFRIIAKAMGVHEK